jgi:hypothetical protein
MRVQGIRWAIVAPFALVSWLLSHGLACQLVAPEAPAHHMLVPGGGAEHAYLPAPALLLAAALALVLVGFLAAIVASARGTRWSRIPLAAVAAAPPLGFTLQEHLEAWLASGGFPATAALEPTFAVGLALQLPLVLAALILARGLLATASRLGSGLRSMVVLRLRPGRPPLRPLRPNALLAPAPLPLASSHAPRAPPLGLLS